MFDPRFFWRTRSAGMGTDHGTVNNQMLHIRVIGQVLMHSMPYTLLAPAGEPLVDTVPSAILRREQSPLSTASGDPKDTFDKAEAFGFLPHVHIWTTTQELQYLRPLFER